MNPRFKKPKILFSLFFFLFLGLTLQAQSFDIDQVEQVYRPRFKIDNRIIFNSPFQDTTGNFNDFYTNAVVTFPIKTKLDAGLNLDLSNLNFKNILSNSVKVNASQILGSVRLGYRQMNLGFDTLAPQKNFYTLSANVTGLKLDKKFRVIFYNAGINILEQDKTFSKPYPRFSGLIGRVHVKGTVKRYYYGLALVYSDGLFLPMPFFGGSVPIGNKVVFNYTIPATINFQFKFNTLNLFTGVTADGFRTGMEMQDMRTNLNHTGGQAYLMLRQKINNSINFRVEGGYYFFTSINISNAYFNNRDYSIRPGPYVNFGFNFLFGKTLFEKVADKVLDKGLKLF